MAFIYSNVEEEVNGMQDTPLWFNVLPQLFDQLTLKSNMKFLANLGPLQSLDRNGTG